MLSNFEAAFLVAFWIKQISYLFIVDFQHTECDLLRNKKSLRREMELELSIKFSIYIYSNTGSFNKKCYQTKWAYSIGIWRSEISLIQQFARSPGKMALTLTCVQGLLLLVAWISYVINDEFTIPSYNSKQVFPVVTTVQFNLTLMGKKPEIKYVNLYEIHYTCICLLWGISI